MTLERLPTGIPGLDDITRGSWIEGGIFLVLGPMLAWSGRSTPSPPSRATASTGSSRRSRRWSGSWELELGAKGLRAMRPFAPFKVPALRTAVEQAFPALEHKPARQGVVLARVPLTEPSWSARRTVNVVP